MIKIINNPQDEFLRELAAFCTKWAGLPEDTQITQCNIEAEVGSIATIAFKMYVTDPNGKDNS